MKKLLIVLFLVTVPISEGIGSTVSQLEIDSAKGFFAQFLGSSDTYKYTGYKYSGSQARSAADAWGLGIKKYLERNKKLKIWPDINAPRNVATCLWSSYVADVLVEKENPYLYGERKDMAVWRQWSSLLRKEGWTDKEIVFCFGADSEKK